MNSWTLKISGRMYKSLKEHLYPGDGYEAVAIALCGRHRCEGNNSLLVHKIIPIPYDNCSVRTPDRVSWSTDIIIPYLQEASRKGLAILKIHSHPGGYSKFSDTDNFSDKDLFSSVYGWMESEEPHASAVLLPDDKIFGRIIYPDLSFHHLAKVNVVGDDLIFCFSKKEETGILEFEKRTAQTFGKGTTNLLKNLTVAVIGCSGTGSPTIEQIVRLGVGKIILVDPDVIEEKNLNRILNSTMQDAFLRKSKVEMFKEQIAKIGLGTEVVIFSKNLYDDKNAINCLSGADFMFGCVDSVDGRHLLNQISTFYLVPYLDLGVKIISDGKGGISQICGSVHYIQPGGGSLLTRRVYTQEGLRAAGMLRSSPEEYRRQKKNGYIVDVEVDSPAVISINMQISSLAVNEFLARIHPFRSDPNREFDINRISISDGYYQHEEDSEIDQYLKKFVGRGNLAPLLNMPELS